MHPTLSELRTIILNSINKAEEEGLDIDISHFDALGRGTKLILRGTDMTGYYSTIIGKVHIYDRHGDKLKKYQLVEYPMLKRRVGNPVKYKYDNSDLIITLTRDTNLDSLEKLLSESHESVYIYCNNILIPPFSVKINTSKLFLNNPIVTTTLMNSIDCYYVGITVDDYYPSYLDLHCKKFALTYDADFYYSHIMSRKERFPIMPKDATDISIEINCQDRHDLTFIGNDNIESLELSHYFDGDEDANMGDLSFHLQGMPNLRKLTTSKSTAMPEGMLHNIEELDCSVLDLIITSKNGIGYVGSIEDYDYTTGRLVGYDGEGELYVAQDETLKLHNLHTFKGDLYISSTYSVMPDLKVLYVRELISEANIPLSLEEYHVEGMRYWEEDIDKVVRMSKYLMSMPTIKRMSLYLSDEEDYNYPISNRPDIYYDIYLLYGDVIPYEDVYDKEGLEDYTFQLAEVLHSNEQFKRRNAELSSLLG